MADKNDGGDKTEKPTPKRLQDARKKGDVPKSKEVTSTVGLVVWLGVGALAVAYAPSRMAQLFDSLFATIAQGWSVTGYAGAVRAIGGQAAELALLLVAMLLVPAAAVGLLTDFLQAGPVLTFEKVKPKLDQMNPVEGVKRMFSMDNVIEVVKALAKTALLFLIGWLVVRAALPQIVGLARAPTLPPQAVGAMVWDLTVQALAWTVAVFAMVSLLDAAYQRYSFTKKMRMSLRDIKQEMKESEGDPHIKAQRRQAHQEWSQSNAAQAARGANVLVVNPTHVAIAIDYDRETTPVPTIAFKGEDHVARAMREAAEEAGVPIVRNVPLARDLLARGEIGEIVPADLFEIIAEVILWAREVRQHVDAQRAADPDAPPLPPRRIAAPGEDLTRYPDPPWNPSS
ncbi:type III secretion system export apparatus subunit SctU [Piscinibacter sp. XHJ-5]|uniref:type III secretion system export apparatus subunit SctU n=1 Tax=Piscinibacter sp. XHJ-5 TaxID=3037797 RepID=UPI0024535F7D|nr:type III secretion system export apparatus subunit SctU [Piscinibacter sp. XHJ-5]